MVVLDLLRTHIDDFPHAKNSLRRIRNLGLRFNSQLSRVVFKKEVYSFQCNVCGGRPIAPMEWVRKREVPSCYYCGSNRRFRSIAAILSIELFGKVITLPDMERSGSITGIGLSDSDIYAKPLGKLFSYRNTYYHKKPRLDIMSIDEAHFEPADFVISSDVFEHVPPPINQAFTNLFRITKEGGVCIFSVPYDNEGITKEHFPDLYKYEIVKKSGNRMLINKTRSGDRQVFDQLRFHGGPGATLELRKFSKPSLLDHIQRAGFVDVKLYDCSFPEFGVLIDEGAPSLIISMRKPL